MQRKYKLDNFTLQVNKEMRKRAFIKQYYYQNQFLYEYNDICPLCKEKLKINYKKVLKGIGLIGTIDLEKEETSLAYALCKACSKRLPHCNSQEKEKIKDQIVTTVSSAINNHSSSIK